MHFSPVVAPRLAARRSSHRALLYDLNVPFHSDKEDPGRQKDYFFDCPIFSFFFLRLLPRTNHPSARPLRTRPIVSLAPPGRTDTSLGPLGTHGSPQPPPYGSLQCQAHRGPNPPEGKDLAARAHSGRTTHERASDAASPSSRSYPRK